MDSVSPVIIATKRALNDAVETAVERAVARLAPRFRLDERNRPGEGKAYLTNAEAMEYLGLSRPTLARYRKDGRLPYSKVGSNVYYRLADIEALLEARLSTASGTRSSG